MLKYFIVSDVHGYYDELISVLNQSGFDKDNPEHVLVSLGNLIDRGPKTKECLEYIMSLDASRRITLLGNHEVNLKAAIERGSFIEGDVNNGTVETAKQLTGADNDLAACARLRANTLIQDYLNSLRNYYETEDVIMVHGWIPCYCIQKLYNTEVFYTYEPRWREATDDIWAQATWLNGMEAWSEGVLEFNKTIICGNYPTPWGNYNLHKKGGDYFVNNGCSCPECVSKRQQMQSFISEEALKEAPDFSPFEDNGIIAIEGCIAYGGLLNCIAIESEPLPEKEEIMDLKFTPKKIMYKANN